MPASLRSSAVRVRPVRMRLPISPWLLAGVVLCTLTVALLAPALASAHGSGTPSATNFLARITHTPDGLQARVVDGDVRMWLRVPGHRTVTVLDTTGAPYLRFSPAGVAVNLNSAIYYLSQNPPLAPPRGITAKTRPRWVSVSAGHSYRWVDERLQALALVARAPGASYVGTWRIPLRIDGRITAITGGLWYRGPPTLVWFWPIFVLLMCVLAALRLRRPQLNLSIARAVAGLTLLGIAVGAVARGFHERPGLSASALILCAVILMLVAGAVWLLRIGTGEAFTYGADRRRWSVGGRHPDTHAVPRLRAACGARIHRPGGNGCLHRRRSRTDRDAGAGCTSVPVGSRRRPDRRSRPWLSPRIYTGGGITRCR